MPRDVIPIEPPKHPVTRLERLIHLRGVIERTPAEQIDLNYYAPSWLRNSCCILGHACKDETFRAMGLRQTSTYNLTHFSPFYWRTLGVSEDSEVFSGSFAHQSNHKGIALERIDRQIHEAREKEYANAV